MAEAQQKDMEFEPSLEDDINAAIDQVAGKDYDPRQEDDGLEQDVKAVLDAQDVEREDDTEEPPEPPEADDDEAEDGDEEADEGEDEGDEEPEGDSGEDDKPHEEDLVAAPEHWPQEDRDAFGKLDAPARNLVLEQNKRFERRHQAHSEQVRESEALREAFAPFEQEMNLAGLSRVDGIRRLVSVHGLLKTEPENGLRWVVTNYGSAIRDKQAFVQSLAREMGVELSAGQEAEPQYLDQKAGTEIDRIKAELSQFKNAQADTAKQANERELQQAAAELNAFIDAKDDAGKLKHPHYERVRMKMHGLWQTDPTRSLADLYNDAVMLDPELRKEIIDREATEKAKVNGKAERRAKAKKAARNVKGVRVGQPNHDEMSIEQLVRASVERSEAR